MDFDGTHGQKVLLFLGETYNSFQAYPKANIRLDKLNLNYTDVATNTDQEQSVNLLNYKVDGSDYHPMVTSAKSCYIVALTDDYAYGFSNTYTTYFVPMVFITATNPIETTFMMGWY